MNRLLALCFLLCTSFLANASDSLINNTTTKKVVVFDITEEIAPAVTRITQKAFAKAREVNADLIIIHMNTYGGLVSDADSIRTTILNSKIPVYVFIDNNAASAGALISISCNKIFMRKGANIGAATVVTQNGEAAPDKYQSYMRSIMRSTAETRGRNPRIAEAMVDQSINIDSISQEGKVITFTPSEAMKNGFCEGVVESISELLEKEGITEYEIIEVKKSAIDKAIGFLANPAFSSILILIILGGIYFELQTPGIGFPILAAFIAALLYFAPLYLEGLAANWEIIAFVIGLLLLGAEIFVIPGFGIAGVSGITLILVSLVLSLVRNVNFDFTLTDTASLTSALFRVLIAIVSFIIIAIVFGKGILNSAVFNRLILQDTLEGAKASTGTNMDDILIGKEGVAFTTIRPFGKVEINNEIYHAKTLGEFIDKGDKIKVTGKEHNMLIIRSA